MTKPVDDDLHRRAAALLEPGAITLHGAVLHTDIPGDDEPALHQATIDAGAVVAEHAGAEDTYVYSGTDDPEFGLNQHQGLTIDGDEFVWECQQLLRGGTFDVVIYWRAHEDHRAVLADLRALGHDVVGLTADGPLR